MSQSRVSNTIKNARVNLVYYLLAIVVAFFSRKIFLDYLGDEFAGLISILQKILGFLNLAELGISTAIGFSLYKPLYQKNKQEVNHIVTYFGYLYKKIGFGILIIGGLVSAAFPVIFPSIGLSFLIVYLAFYTLLVSAALGYLFNYPQTLFQADQKEYMVSRYFQSFTIVKSIIQMGLIYVFKDYYLWIAIELVFAILLTIAFHRQSKKSYPWLDFNWKRASDKIKKYPDILIKVKQLFIHKISFFVLVSTDQFLVYAFVNLESVAFFANYQLIFDRLSILMNKLFSGVQAGVGNLVAENKSTQIQKVFWEMMSLRHFFGGLAFITLFYLTEDFVRIWVGEKYILEPLVLILMLLNLYIAQVRKPVDDFINAYGLFSDVWAPITEAVINLIISIIFGSMYGIPGILFGTLVSTFIIVILWKPYFLYREGFKLDFWQFWKRNIKLICLFAVTMAIVFYILRLVDKSIDSFVDWGIYAIKVSALAFICYSSVLFLFDPGYRAVVKRIQNLLSKN